MNWCWIALMVGNLQDQGNNELLYCSFLARNMDQSFQIVTFCMKFFILLYYFGTLTHTKSYINEIGRVKNL